MHRGILVESHKDTCGIHQETKKDPTLIETGIPQGNERGKTFIKSNMETQREVNGILGVSHSKGIPRCSLD
jgi:hypothetical protein